MVSKKISNPDINLTDSWQGYTSELHSPSMSRMEKINELTEGVEVDLDEPLPPEDDAETNTGGIEAMKERKPFIHAEPTDEQRKKAKQSDLYKRGDMQLVWYLESELYPFTRPPQDAAMRVTIEKALKDFDESDGEHCDLMFFVTQVSQALSTEQPDNSDKALIFNINDIVRLIEEKVPHTEEFRELHARAAGLQYSCPAERPDSHTETIICPSCESEQVATVEHTHPWYSYVHTCECGYTIMESEWERAGNE